MRKTLLVALIVALGITLLAPGASARSPRRTASRNANAFWHSRQRLSGDSYLRITWYVGVYASTRGTWSDLYQSVDKCRVGDSGRRRCSQQTFRIGISDLSGDTFTMDDKRVDEAYLDAVYRLRTYDSDWNRVGRPVRTHIVAEWSGAGDATRSRETFSYHNKCSMFRITFKGLHRSATATGSVDGQELGSTRDAYLSRYSSTSIRHRCRR